MLVQASAYIKTLSAVTGSIIAHILQLAINRFRNQQSWEIVYPDIGPGFQSTMMVDVLSVLNLMLSSLNRNAATSFASSVW